MAPANVEYALSCYLQRPRSTFENQKMERKREKHKNGDLRVLLLKKMYIQAKIPTKDLAILQQRHRYSSSRPAPTTSPQIKCSCKANVKLETLKCELHRWTMMRELEISNSSLTNQEKKTVQRTLAEYKTRSEWDWRLSHHKEYRLYKLPGLSRFGVEALMPAKRRIDVDPHPKLVAKDRWGPGPIY